MGGFSVIAFAACVLVSNVGSGFGNRANTLLEQQIRNLNAMQNIANNQLKRPYGGAEPFPVRTYNPLNAGPGFGVASTAGARAGAVSAAGPGFGGLWKFGGPGGGYGGGSSTIVSSGGPGGGVGVVQTVTDINGKQSVLVNDNGNVTAYEIPPGGGTVFTAHNSQGGPGVAASSYHSSYSNSDGDRKSSGGGVVDDNGKITTFGN